MVENEVKKDTSLKQWLNLVIMLVVIYIIKLSWLMGYIINCNSRRRGNIYSCCSSDGIANIDDVVTIELSHDLGDTTRC
jgi:hypothetical protein